jgi:hypothetical protein
MSSLVGSCQDAVQELKDHLSQRDAWRGLYRLYATARASFHAQNDDDYRAMAWCCRAKRILDVDPDSAIERLYRQLFEDLFRAEGGLCTIAGNGLLKAFLASPEAERIRRFYSTLDDAHTVSMKLPRPHDIVERQGNLVVLKKQDPARGEKGVLYLKFNHAFKEFTVLFDVEKIARDYRLVLEPSTWGYMEETFHLLVGKDLDVVVQAQDETDWQVIHDMDTNLRPIRMGAGDWIDTSTFANVRAGEKRYDIAMIASWLRLKRHEVLFRALARMDDANLRIALVGYPIGHRTMSDVKGEARKHDVLGQIDFYERIRPAEVAEILAHSKLSVILTKREGAVRAIYESLLCGAPVVLYRHNRGVNREVINSETGRLADDEELAEVLSDVIRHHEDYEPQTWARRNIGMANSHRKLDEMAGDLAARAGESYEVPICRIKAGTTPYVDSEDRERLTSEFAVLERYLRPGIGPAR